MLFQNSGEFQNFQLYMRESLIFLLCFFYRSMYTNFTTQCYFSYLAEDLRSKLGKVLYDRNFTIEKQNVFIAEVLPTWLAHFERLAPEINRQENNDSFFIADRLTWIDYLVFELIACNVEFSKSTVLFLKDNNVEEDILENFPRLNNFYKTFSRRPQLEKYLVSKSRRAFKLPFPPTIV